MARKYGGFMHRSARTQIKDIFDLIWAEVTPFVRRRVVLVLGLVLASAILAPLGPLALQLVIDRFNGNAVTTLAIAVPAALYVVSQWLFRSLNAVRGFAYARAERRIFTAVSERFFHHVMQLPLRFHLQRSTGAISKSLENGLQGVEMILHHTALTALPVLAQLAATAWILLRLEQPIFFVIFAGGIVCYIAAFSYFLSRMNKSAEEASAALVSANSLMTDSVLNFETVKFFAAEAVVRTRVREALVGTEQRWVGFFRTYAINGLVVGAVLAIFLTLTMVVALREVSAGRMTVGEFVLVNTYVLQLVQPMEMLGYAVQCFAQGTAMLTKMLELLREPCETIHGALRPGATARRLDKSRSVEPATLEFRNVSLSYESGRPVLCGVSFVLPTGRTLGVVGSSGGGKSTIVRWLVRLLEPETGEIAIDGRNVQSMSLDELRHAIAVVPQDTVLFNDTIRYNIAFGRPSATQEEIEHAARLAHLDEFIARQPEGYETRVGERGIRLSGGEKQRLSIARAAIKQPRIYVFDEATSSLDSATERRIMCNLRDISRHCTTVIIAHRLSTIVHADEIIVLKHGIVIERGSHRHLLRQHGEYAALWSVQHPSPVATSSGAVDEA
jgi:ABC-type transport system involved in Fe-S cluster assembly fused permease/ATPase subunit